MPILEILALAVSLVTILVAWRATQQVKQLTAKLDRLQTTLYETRQEQRAQQEHNEQRIAALEVSVQRASGKMRFDPNTSLTRLFEVEPRAAAVLAAFHIGGCASCAVDENETLAQVARERGADLERILTALNTLPLNDGQADLRMPNVRFQV
jgi:hypothetical protein